MINIFIIAKNLIINIIDLIVESEIIYILIFFILIKFLYNLIRGLKKC